MIQDAEDFEHGIVVAARACGGAGIAAALHDSVLVNFYVICGVMAYTIGARRGALTLVEFISVIHVYFVGVSEFAGVLCYSIVFKILLKFVFGTLGGSKVKITEQTPVACSVIGMNETHNLL